MLIKRLVALVALLASSVIFTSRTQEISLKIQQPSEQSSALKLSLRVISQSDLELNAIAQNVAKTLTLTGQFLTDVVCAEQPKTKKDITDIFNQGYALAIFLSHSVDKQAIDWRLYDVTNGTEIKCRRFYKLGNNVLGWAYNLADDIWFELKQQQSSFASKIAYIKKTRNKFGEKQSSICVSNFDGSHEKTIYTSPGTYVGLYWHNETLKPRLFCSEFTRFKVRLDSFDMDGNKKVVLNFDGTCVGISLGKNTNEAVYCLSGNIWKFKYNKAERKSNHTCIIKNDGKNSTPTLLANGDIIFCSDARSLRKKYKDARGPQICYYNDTTKEIQLLTQDGYCVAPSYAPVTRKLAYSKKINGVMQLFVYDFKTGNHQQVTFDGGNKIDCNWSPCGNYLIFCLQEGSSSRIAAMHIVLRERWFVTGPDVQAFYPSWSPVCKMFPDF